MRILVASSSVFRQQFYQEVAEKLGHEVSVTSGGLDCVSQLRSSLPDLLILEAPLHWGGSEGVLEVAQNELGSSAVPVILVAVGAGPIDWFQLSRFRIDDFLFRLPTLQELGLAVAGIAERRSGSKLPTVADTQETSFV
jgi:DNA-binding response OmpR family regulator